MPLAKLTELKSRLEISGSASDTVLGQALADAQALIDSYCRRELLYVAADSTELFDGDTFDLRLKRWPIAGYSGGSLTLPVVKMAWDYDWTAATALVENEGYRVRWTRGMIEYLPHMVRWPSGIQHIQVVYRGGYNDPAATAITGVAVVPAHIQQACLIQAAECFQRMKEPGYKAVAGMTQGMSSGSAPDMELVRAARNLLVNERR